MSDIKNSSSYAWFSGTEEHDSIYNSGSYSTIRGLGGDDIIENHDYGFATKLYGNDGNDSIYNLLDYVVVNGEVTINGGAGDDTLTGSANHGEIYVYKNGDGNDGITNFDSLDSMRITDSSGFSTVTSGSDIIVRVGSGSVRIKNGYGKNLSIISAHHITNQGNISSLYGLDPIVRGTRGRDYIRNIVPYSTINAGDGDDIIDNRGLASILYGGAGDDSIKSGSSVKDSPFNAMMGGLSTISGDTGNDTLTGLNNSADVFLYADGDGNDIITNYETNDIIKIVDGVNWSTQISGSDVIVNVGSGKMTLKDAYNKTINVVSESLIDKDINEIHNYEWSSIVDGTSGRDSIENIGDYVTINGGADNDIISNKGNYAVINAGKGNDTLVNDIFTFNVYQYANGDGNDLITNYDTSDTIKITDGSSWSTTRSGSDVIIRIGSGSMTLKNAAMQSLNIVGGTNTANSDTVVNNDGHYIINRSNYSVVSGSSGDDSIQNLGKYVTINADDNDDVIINSAGGVKIYGGGGSDSIYNSTTYNNTINGAHGFVTIDGGSGNDTIENHDPNVLINGETGDDFIDSYDKNVTINGGVGNDFIYVNGLDNVIEYAADDGNDTVSGYGVFTTLTLRLTDDSDYSTMTSGNDMIVNVGNNSIKFINGITKNPTIIGGTNSNDSASSNFITLSNDNPSINNARSNVSIQGADNDNFIFNSGSNVSIHGEEGNDTLSTSANATLIGGEGNDVFRIAPPSPSKKISVTLTDLTDEDTIEILSSNTTGFTCSIQNGTAHLINNTSKINLNVGGVWNDSALENKNIRLKNDVGMLRTTTTLAELSTMIPDGVKLNSSGKTLTVKTPFEGTIRADDFSNVIKTINASSNPNAVELIGNDNANVLKASKGGSTLSGGLGNDKLYGGAGADIFIYDGGKDQINKYESGDRIVINKAIDNVKLSGSNIKFTFNDKDILTVKKVRDKEMTIVDIDGIEEKYIFTKQNKDLDSARIISNDQLPSYWFEQSVEEDQLSTILETNAAVDFDLEPLKDTFQTSINVLSIGIRNSSRAIRRYTS